MSDKKGCVYLVGAGPGDPKLITVRGLEILRSADAVIYDRLGTAELIKEAKNNAELIDVGKARGKEKMSQPEINALLVELAKQGKNVCRLKGGDPFVFGRGGEEGIALTESGTLWEVVPGITSAIAAPTYAGIPVTHRLNSSMFTVVTGNNPDAIDFKTLAKSQGTIVMLMARATLHTIAHRLTQHGMDALTPCAVVENATVNRQRSVFGTLSNISAITDKAKIKAPVVVVIGSTVSLRTELGWFTRKPLLGKSVVVTRARSQASRLARKLTEQGAVVFEVPTINITPPTDTKQLDTCIKNISRYDWVTFVSPNAVEYTVKRMRTLGADARNLANVKVAAVGEATTKAVANWLGIVCDLSPTSFNPAEVLQEFNARGITPKRVLHPRSSIGRDSLPNRLRSIGAVVDEVVAYENTIDTSAAEKAQLLYNRNTDAVPLPDYTLFTSSSTVKNLYKLLQGKVETLNKSTVVCIGQTTAQTCLQLGIKTNIVAVEPSLCSMVNSVLKHAKPK